MTVRKDLLVPFCASLAVLGFSGALTAQDDLIAQGKLIFEETAGDVGCASCHGMDGKGDVGPDIRGRTADDVAYAKSSIEDMAFFELTTDEMEAVAAYLATLP